MNKYRWIAVILFFTLVLTLIYVYKKDKRNCLNPFEVKDFTSGKERVMICDKTLYKGSVKVVDNKEYPDLFQFLLNKDSKPNEVKQYVRIFEKDKTELVSVKSTIDYGSWNSSAIGIYRKEKSNTYTLIFKKAFKDNPGRWINIEFGEDFSNRDPYFYLNYQGSGISISRDIGYLGCYGACRLLWWDYYDWDPVKKTFVLANNKNPEAFKKLLENYKQLDKNACLDESSVTDSISELYPIRKDKEKICSDDATAPFTTAAQAEMLLKGKKAIELIIGGENISMSDVGKVKIN
ncbi:hypothetical protein HZC27_02950 [Candidatus Roizmanbacteria bacterium]|nr:hypothetical protein [Candidatus Roizmanbacteria bacterium]